MLVFVLGLAIFFAVHLVPVLAPAFRDGIVERMGKSRWMIIYSALSLAGFVIMVFGWGQFRPVAPQLYEPPSWGRDVTMSLVWLSFILFALPRRKPGRILSLVRHPMVTGVILWSIGHLLANGDQASVILFGSFLVFALLSRITKFSSDVDGPQFVSYRSDIVGIVAGTVLYAIFVLWIHLWLFGVSPI